MSVKTTFSNKIYKNEKYLFLSHLKYFNNFIRSSFEDDLSRKKKFKDERTKFGSTKLGRELEKKIVIRSRKDIEKNSSSPRWQFSIRDFLRLLIFRFFGLINTSSFALYLISQRIFFSFGNSWKLKTTFWKSNWPDNCPLRLLTLQESCTNIQNTE